MDITTIVVHSLLVVLWILGVGVFAFGAVYALETPTMRAEMRRRIKLVRAAQAAPDFWRAVERRKAELPLSPDEWDVPLRRTDDPVTVEADAPMPEIPPRQRRP